MKIRIKPADGVEREAEIVKREEGGFICPCCEIDIGVVACPKCGADVPPNFCKGCGCFMGGMCVMCGQPGASEIGTMIGGERRAAVLADVFEIRELALEGIVEAYASSDVKDSHGTIIVPDEVLAKALAARVDQMHDERPVDGISIVEAKKVLRLVDEKEVECVKTTLRFDLAVEAARSAFEKIRDGTYKGLSIGFFIAKSLGEKIQAGITDVIDRIEALPFISLVDRPSNGMALIENYRRAPEALAEGQVMEETPAEVPAALDAPEVLAHAGEKLGSLFEAPSTPEPQAEIRAEIEPETEDPIPQLRSEMAAQIETVSREIRKVVDFLDGKVTPAFELAKRHTEGEVSKLTRMMERFETGIRRWVQEEIAKLRVAPPKREIELDAEPEIIARGQDAIEPVSFPPRFIK